MDQQDMVGARWAKTYGGVLVRGRRGLSGVGPLESDSCESGGPLFFRRLAMHRNFAQMAEVLSSVALCATGLMCRNRRQSTSQRIFGDSGLRLNAAPAQPSLAEFLDLR